MAHKPDAYQIVTDRIVAALEQGIVPWSKPWRAVAGYGPTSLTTGKPYQGANVLTLGVESLLKGYSSQYWTTYKQCAERGGSVRKGEKATPVVFWRIVKKEGKKPDDKPETFAVLRYFSVFNTDQCDGLSVPTVEPLKEFDPIAEAERIADGMPHRPTVKHSPQDRAYYSPLLDYVHMPNRGMFGTAEGYYGTLFHELVHSTGHSSRLNRKGIEAVAPFGSETYAKEELVAELGAAFLCGDAGINPRIPQHASYVASWLAALKDDKRLIVTAASAAGKAASYIAGRTPDDVLESE